MRVSPIAPPININNPGRHTLTLLLLTVVLLQPVFAWPAATTVAATDRDARLWQLVAERLSWMPAVARWKQIRGLPIEDLPREARVLQASTERATALGLPTREIQDFMQLQMDLAKHIQTRTLRDDSRHSDDSKTHTAPPDLVTEIRPALNQVGAALMLQIALFRADVETPQLQVVQQLEKLGLKKSHIDQLTQSLKALSVAPAHPVSDRDNDPENDPHNDPYKDRLQLIKARGVLRVGSTGDYAPFSLRTSDEADPAHWHGIDLELAENLATALQVDLMIVPTSWPDLLVDLQADRFDIAMSGISRRLFRAEAGYFSDAYHVGGKMPIIRCSDAKKFSSLSQIDQRAVRVIVNPGGTNERFTRTTIQNASIQMFADNRDIFQQIVAGDADVMFTDAIEVRLQTQQEPTLCAALADPLNYQSKGILMQRDNHLLHYINLWLEELHGSGTLQDVFTRHLSKG